MLLHMQESIIVIPCYNEANRLDPGHFIRFVQSRPGCSILFVDDGSTDRTAMILDHLALEMPKKIRVLHLPLNQGKATAVTSGIRLALRPSPGEPAPDLIGYLDADLSTSLEEWFRLAGIVQSGELDYAFASRVRMLGSTIDRSAFRHLSGRLIATLIDSRYRLGIYDTQCGAKVFRPTLASALFEPPFTTRWLFDVEIFLRIRRLSPPPRGEEIPLLEWKSTKHSGLNALAAPAIAAELTKLFKTYPR